ncbi:MAG: CarD family transcriptional regulator, partial [Alphaproteobacteria bacterium]
MAAKKKSQQSNGFQKDEYVVYPTHGVGRIIAIEEQEIAGCKLELFVINFEKDKMTLRVPTGKCESAGMRKLSDDSIVGKALTTLKGRARVKRTMWSRRAQEYETKINSGDPVSIAEVVRDLWRRDQDRGLSAGEKRMLAKARQILVSELALAEHTNEDKAEAILNEV